MAKSLFPCEHSAMDGNLGGKSLPRSDVATVDAYSHALAVQLRISPTFFEVEEL